MYLRGDDEKNEDSESRPTPDSVSAIKACRAGLKKKLEIVENFKTYIDDS
jgi:hypothetical protein